MPTDHTSMADANLGPSRPTDTPERAGRGRSKAVVLVSFLGGAAVWVSTSYAFLPLDNYALAGGVLLPGPVVLLSVVYQLRDRPPTLKHWIAAAAPWGAAGLVLINGALDGVGNEYGVGALENLPVERRCGSLAQRVDRKTSIAG